MPLTRWIWGLGIVFLGILLAGSIYMGGPVGYGAGVDVKAGRQYAERNCARCHAVGPTGVSPFDQAPPFRTFAKRWPLESLDEALAEGIVVGHPAMPEFKLSPRQISNFMGYLETIQR